MKYASPSLIAHEQVHVEQQKRDGWRFYWRYLSSRWWRMMYEAEAYAESARWPGAKISGLAWYLSGKTYGHCCTYEEAEEAIRSFLPVDFKEPPVILYVYDYRTGRIFLEP